MKESNIYFNIKDISQHCAIVKPAVELAGVEDALSARKASSLSVSWVVVAGLRWRIRWLTSKPAEQEPIMSENRSEL